MLLRCAAGSRPPVCAAPALVSGRPAGACCSCSLASSGRPSPPLASPSCSAAGSACAASVPASAAAVSPSAPSGASARAEDTGSAVGSAAATAASGCSATEAGTAGSGCAATGAGGPSLAAAGAAVLPPLRFATFAPLLSRDAGSTTGRAPACFAAGRSGSAAGCLASAVLAADCFFGATFPLRGAATGSRRTCLAFAGAAAGFCSEAALALALMACLRLAADVGALLTAGALADALPLAGAAAGFGARLAAFDRLG